MRTVPGQSGFTLKVFLGSIALAFIGIMVVGAAMRVVSISPLARLGVTGFFVAGGVAAAAAKKRWDVVLSVALTVVVLAAVVVWMTSSVVGTID
jgi:hypothetical protein